MKKEVLTKRIIGDSVAIANNNDIRKKAELLPGLYCDALTMRFGLDGEDPMSDEEIAEELGRTTGAYLSEYLVNCMINDALYMVNYRINKRNSFSFKISPIDKLKLEIFLKPLSWESIIKLMEIVRNSADIEGREDLLAELKTKYSKKDIVIAPNIEDLYFVNVYPVEWSDPEGAVKTLNPMEVVDIREFAEEMFSVLEELGVLIISDAPKYDKVSAHDIYKYAYLDEEFAARIAYDNPRLLSVRLKEM